MLKRQAFNLAVLFGMPSDEGRTLCLLCFVYKVYFIVLWTLWCEIKFSGQQFHCKRVVVSNVVTKSIFNSTPKDLMDAWTKKMAPEALPSVQANPKSVYHPEGNSKLGSLLGGADQCPDTAFDRRDPNVIHTWGGKL